MSSLRGRQEGKGADEADDEQEEERERERERARKSEREVFLTIKKRLRVGKYTALSGNTASGRSGPST